MAPRAHANAFLKLAKKWEHADESGMLVGFYTNLHSYILWDFYTKKRMLSRHRIWVVRLEYEKTCRQFVGVK